MVNHTKKLNGNVHAAVDLACAQSALGHEVFVCSGTGDFDQLLYENNVGVINVEFRRNASSLVKSILLLRQIIKNRKIEIVHAHMMLSAIISWFSSRFLKASFVTTAHNAFERSSLLMGLGDRVIAVSENVKKTMIKKGIREAKIRTVLNGTIGAARLKSLNKEGRILERGSIMFIGGLHPRKGVIDLINAYDKIFRLGETPRLYIVGEGPHRREYESFCRTLSSNGNITFLGPTDDPLSLLRFADIFVLASHADPAPLVLAEARQAGCAIIGTRVDGIPELLNGGKSGILVRAGDVLELAEAMSSLTHNVSNLRTWKENSQIDIEFLNIERVARATLDVYYEIYK
ncbi:glycosyltransferase family 4 protein [Methylobacterium sp. J-001]|uniref:glycosyltransferase family 4 protein n=1 Tax=Methylobacterium sp. J-001 TaxID=2836609 RepID=UPI001FB9EA00|nr:glycosyltransferase family 4 protein [Methylobacterium sp. J-001]MCJ2115649.1 glycosyltransferase family 4 protein [Methylobacterium sp. J-001]